jgi:hypothetical protein
MSPIDAALEYAACGWHVFLTRAKAPITIHGFKDATVDAAVITSGWQRWPDAVPAVATGAVSGIVVLDVDVDFERGIDGRDALDLLGITTHPVPDIATRKYVQSQLWQRGIQLMGGGR